MVKFTKVVLLVLLTVTILSCSFLSKRTYTTKNLAQLPCEGVQQSFIPIEFDEIGNFLYVDQINKLNELVEEKSTQDVYFFIHGWDKTVAIAEQDYQKFICGFVNASLSTTNDTNTITPRNNASIIVGLFCAYSD